MSDNTIYGFRGLATRYFDTVVTPGGEGYGVTLYMGRAFRDRSNTLGIALGSQYSSLGSKLPELAGKSDSMKGLSLFVDRWEWSDNGTTFARDMGGLGAGSFCPGVGDICWPALYANSSSSFLGVQVVAQKDFGLSVSLDINSQSYLHLISDEERRQYSHPSQVFGIGLSLDLRFGTPSIGSAKGEPLTPQETIHEVVKYILDDVKIFFGARTGSDPLQKGKELLTDAGIGDSNPGPATQPTATTNAGSMLALQALSGALGRNAHMDLFEKMDPTLRPAFFWGNVANTGLLVVLASAMDSGAMLQGGLSSLRHTANLLPILQGASAESAYWVRFLTPHLMALGGLAAGGGRQSFFGAAAEGWVAPAFHAGNSKELLESRTWTYSVYHASTQAFDTGSLKGQRSEVAVENKLKPSGLSTRAAFVSPTIGLWNGNVVATLDNIATSAGVVGGNGSALDAPTLPTTVSSMVGWRGAVGDGVQFTASVFGGLAMDLGPQPSPQLGVGCRASAGARIGFGDKNWLQIGAEGFVGGAKFSNSTTTDHGVALMVTLRP